MRHRLSVVVPAYNEGPSIAEVLTRLDAALEPLRQSFDVELIVVDDGSTDDTAMHLAAFGASHPDASVRTHAVNAGLVEALKTGTRAACGDVIVHLDADLSYAPEIVGPLAQTLLASGASAVLASPYMRGGRVENVPFDRIVASRVANWLLSLCVGGRLKTFTGMVRAYDSAAILAIMQRPTRGEFNAWVVSELLRDGRTIVEIPAALVWPAARTQAPSRMTPRKLWSRMVLVVETARVLLASGRADPRSRSHVGT